MGEKELSPSVEKSSTREVESIVSARGPVAFEEYLYYAALQRHAESIDPKAGASGNDNQAPAKPDRIAWFSKLSEHKGTNVNFDPNKKNADIPMTAEEEERAAASRSMRLASWISVFYLITADILGPFNAPFAISQVGWIPGILLYFFMACVAMYTGLILWRLFVRLDSERYPLRTYSDIVERIYGKRARQATSFLQNIQLLVVVGVNSLANGQAFSQITKGKVCFAVCIIIWTLVGMILGQVRSLRAFGWIANNSIWINVIIIITSMAFVVHSPPNFDAAQKSLGVPFGPVMTQKSVSLPLYLQVTGIMNMVFAYGGAMIFPEIMAEMKRPMDFWKGMTLAQLFIFFLYILYGSFIYAFQGQFTLPLAYQGVSKFSWQTVGNVLSLFSVTIATALYGNIGSKVVYRSFVEGYFKGPRLMTPKGQIIWSGIVVLYWAIAFVIGSAIPQVQTIIGLIASIAIMQFTYTFPPLLRFGYDVITDAMMTDGVFVPGNGATGRVDNWSQWSRWKRGLFGGRWYFKLFNLLLGLGGLAMACLGMWGSGLSIKAIFALSGSATSFGCKPPV